MQDLKATRVLKYNILDQCAIY